MGCSQSKANDVVIEPITAPPSECGKPSIDLAFTEIILDDREETSTSIPPPLVEEEEVEEEDEEVAAPIEEEPVEQPVEMVEEPVVVEEQVVAQTEAVEEPPAEEEEEEPAEPEVEAEDAVELQEEKSAATSVSASVWTFVAEKVTFSVGVAFFNFAGSNGEGAEVNLTKRYSEFKALRAEMAKIMTREELPGMPGTSFLQSRNDKVLLQEREVTFVKMLNAIAQHSEASQSAPFAAFLA